MNNRRKQSKKKKKQTEINRKNVMKNKSKKNVEEKIKEK